MRLTLALALVSLIYLSPWEGVHDTRGLDPAVAAESPRVWRRVGAGVTLLAAASDVPAAATGRPSPEDLEAVLEVVDVEDEEDEDGEAVPRLRDLGPLGDAVEVDEDDDDDEDWEDEGPAPRTLSNPKPKTLNNPKPRKGRRGASAAKKNKERRRRAASGPSRISHSKRLGFNPRSTKLPRLFPSWQAPFERVIRKGGRNGRNKRSRGMMLWDPKHNRSGLLQNVEPSVINNYGRAFWIHNVTCKNVELTWEPFVTHIPDTSVLVGPAPEDKVPGHLCAQWRNEEEIPADTSKPQGRGRRFIVTDYFVCRLHYPSPVDGCNRCGAVLRRERRVYGDKGLRELDILTHRHMLPKVFLHGEYLLRLPPQCPGIHWDGSEL